MARLFIQVVLPLVLVGGLLSWGSSRLYHYILRLENFNLAEVEVNKESPLTKSEIESLLDLPRIISIFELNLSTIQEKIKSSAKVEAVQVFRELPHRLRLELVPEKPIFVGNNGRLRYFNREGRVISRVGPKSDLSLPLVSFQDESIDSPIVQRRIQSVVKIIEAMDQHSSLKVEDVGDIVVRSAKYRGKAEIKMTIMHRVINNAKRKIVSISFASDNEVAQVNRLASVIKNLPYKQIKLSTIRLELGKKVIVKIAQ